MGTPRDALTPDALALLQQIARSGSFAAAAREAGVVPSALTYRVRQIEDALDVLLFDRSSRNAKLTAAGAELLREGERLLSDLDAVANRVKRVATGWEAQLTLSLDGIVCRTTVLELCEAFYTLNPPTRLKLREETLSGTLEALTSGQADLAIGVPLEAGQTTGVLTQAMGSVRFVFAVAPHHPLATAPEPLADALIQQHRAVAVADSVSRGGGVTIGLLGGQDVFTVATMAAKLEAQLRGLGAGFLPEGLVKPHIDAGRLVVKQVARPTRLVRVSYAWRPPARGAETGRALAWWLERLQHASVRAALLQREPVF